MRVILRLLSISMHVGRWNSGLIHSLTPVGFVIPLGEAQYDLFGDHSERYQSAGPFERVAKRSFSIVMGQPGSSVRMGGESAQSGGLVGWWASQAVGWCRLRKYSKI